MSMRNKDTWEYAHKVCGIIWRNVGFILLIITLIISIVPKIPLEKVGLGLIIVDSLVMIGTIPVIEYKLRKKFDIDGNKKSNS